LQAYLFFIVKGRKDEVQEYQFESACYMAWNITHLRVVLVRRLKLAENL